MLDRKKSGGGGTLETQESSYEVSRFGNALRKIKKNIRGQLSRIAPIAAVFGSLLVHEAALHPVVKKAWDENIVQPWRDWQAEKERLEMEQQMESDLKESYGADKELVEERNKPRLERVKERQKAAEAFKHQLQMTYKTISYDDIFFAIEYFNQGVEDGELQVAKDVFALKSDEMVIQNPEDPQVEELELIATTLMPPGSYNVTRSSAVYSLAQNLAPKTQNCDARTKLAVMELAKKYPQAHQHIFIQRFGDHRRALFEVRGKRYIFEGGAVMVFPDNLTEKYKNEVMPFEVWLGMYAGLPRSGFESRIEKFGPPKRHTEDFPHVTDNLVPDFASPDLDNLITAEQWSALSRAAHNENNEQTDGIAGPQAGMTIAEQTAQTPTAKTESGKTILDKEEPLMSVNIPMQPTELVIGNEQLTTDDLARILSNEQILSGKNSINFPNLREISPEVAGLLMSKIQGKLKIHILSFPALRIITEDTARELEKTPISIVFRSITSLSVEAAQGFRDKKSSLSFYGLKIISAEAAEALVGPAQGLSDFFDLNTLLPETANSDFAVNTKPDNAQVFREYQGQLHVEGLIGLSKEAGEALGRYQGPLSFENCNMSPGAERGIGENTNYLSLKNPPTTQTFAGLVNHRSGLRIETDELTEIQAENIARMEKNSIFLRVKNLTSAAAKKLSSKKIAVVIEFFPPDYVLQADLAEVLATFQSLNISGIGEIPPPAAQKLVQNNKSNTLDISLQKLSKEAAGFLAEFKGYLSINFVGRQHLLQVDPRVLEGFKNARKPVSIRGISQATPELMEVLVQPYLDTSFSGFQFTPEVAKIIARYPKNLDIHKIGLESIHALVRNRREGKLTFYIEESTIEQLKAMLEYKGPLGLYNLPALTPELAAMLAEHQGDLMIDGPMRLQEMTPEIAKILARHKGGLNMPIFGAITPEVAEALLPLQGFLTIPVKITDPKVARILHKRAKQTRVFMMHQIRIEKPDDPNSWVDKPMPIVEP